METAKIEVLTVYITSEPARFEVRVDNRFIKNQDEVMAVLEPTLALIAERLGDEFKKFMNGAGEVTH